MLSVEQFFKNYTLFVIIYQFLHKLMVKKVMKMKLNNKKIIIITISAIMMILISQIFAFSDQNFKPQYGVTTTNVNLRKQANLNYDSRISTLSSGTKLKIVGTLQDFYIVELENSQVGLVSKDYVDIQGNSLENAQVYENIAKYKARVDGNRTNLRSGPGTNYSVYKILNEGDIVEVIGRINDFLMVVTQDNTVGMIREDLVSYYQENTSTPSTPNTTETPSQSTDPVAEVIALINQARIENGLSPLSVDELLQATAQTKAKDMVDNNYFSHTSPTYGSPFQMMQNAGVLYKTAGENIAGNSSIQAAVTSWLNSPSHKENILSNAYNYLGVGVEKSDTYGYVIVVMFIGK